MAGAIVWPWFFSGGETVVNVPPIIGGGVGRIDVDRFDSVDQLQDALDFGPAMDAQEDFAARADERHGCVRLAPRRGAQNVDA